MRVAKLYTDDGEYVATVEPAIFLQSDLTELVVWGNRFFVWEHGRSAHYREVMVTMVKEIKK